MCVMSNHRGHNIYFEESDNCWRYVDNNEELSIDNERECISCGHKPTELGHDYCISNLGHVVNACCGHGKEKGYIQFNDGTVIRGYFEIERGI